MMHTCSADTGWRAGSLATSPACESTDERALGRPCNAGVDHAQADAEPSPAPRPISSTIPSPGMSRRRPGCT